MEINKIIVHDGIFHADDVMCVAIAKMINPDVEVERVRIAPRETEENTVVCDIGRGKYDHHQKDAEKRPDGNKYAACGLLLRDCWKDILPNWEAYERFNKSVIMPIEDADNGVKKNELSAIISSYIPPRGSRTSMNKAFNDAVDFMKGYLDRYIEREIVREKTEILVKSELNEMDKRNGNVVVLPESIPCNYLLVPSNAKYYVTPEDRGGWGLWCVPAKLNSYENKAPLPEEWLKNPPKGCGFIHNNRFLATFRDFNDLKAAVKELTGEEISNDRKYELVKDDVFHDVSKTSDLYRVRYLKDFETVTGLKIHAGDLGGYIEGEWNLSQYDNSYVGGDAWVWDKARIKTGGILIGGEVSGDARVQNGGVVVNSNIKEDAVVDGGTVIDKSTISGFVWVTDHGIVGGGSELSGEIEVRNHEEIYGEKANSMKELWGGIKPGIGKETEAVLTTKEVSFEKPKMIVESLDYRTDDRGITTSYVSNEKMNLWEKNYSIYGENDILDEYDGEESGKILTTKEMVTELDSFGRVCDALADEEVEVYQVGGDTSYDISYQDNKWVVAKYEGMKDDKIHIFSSMEDAISDIKDEIEGMRENIEFDDFEL